MICACTPTPPAKYPGAPSRQACPQNPGIASPVAICQDGGQSSCYWTHAVKAGLLLFVSAAVDREETQASATRFCELDLAGGDIPALR